jgi:hypothetical protein
LVDYAAAVADSGVVDQHVESTVSFDDLGDHPVHLLRVAHVAGHELGSGQWVFRLVPSTSHDGRAGVDEDPADSGTDTAHAARDEHDGTAQAQVHAC